MSRKTQICVFSNKTKTKTNTPKQNKTISPPNTMLDQALSASLTWPVINPRAKTTAACAVLYQLMIIFWFVHLYFKNLTNEISVNMFSANFEHASFLLIPHSFTATSRKTRPATHETRHDYFCVQEKSLVQILIPATSLSILTPSSAGLALSVFLGSHEQSLILLTFSLLLRMEPPSCFP